MQNEPVILELLGHRKLAGYLTETEIAGAKFLRIDVPTDEGKNVTQFYSPSAVYCITPTTKEMVSQMAHSNSPAPVSRFNLLPPVEDNMDDDIEGINEPHF